MRKIPMRKCVVTKEQHPKKDLIRVVLTPEGKVEVDKSGKMNGRGAYLVLREDVIEKAKLSKALDRALKTKLDDSVYEALYDVLNG